LGNTSEKTILFTIMFLVLGVGLGSYMIFSTAFAEPNLETGDGPRGLGINAFTNKIYVANYISDSVSVIDGVTNTIEAIIQLEGGGPFAVSSGATQVAVNPYYNLVYINSPRTSCNRNCSNYSVSCSINYRNRV